MSENTKGDLKIVMKIDYEDLLTKKEKVLRIIEHLTRGFTFQKGGEWPDHEVLMIVVSKDKLDMLTNKLLELVEEE